MRNTNTEDVIEIDLQELLGLLLHWLWLIVLSGLIAGALGFGISKFMITPQYQSTTKVYILNKQDSGNVTYSDVQLGTQLTKDYAQLIKGRYVLEKVLITFGLAENYSSFAERVTVETLTDTRIIAITVEDTDPVMAQAIANEIRIVASEHIKSVMDIQAVNVAEEANLPEMPSSPSIFKWTAVGAMVGIFLCAMILVIRFLLDDSIKTSDDVERYLGLSTLAMIPVMETEEKHKHKRKSVRNAETTELMSKDESEEKTEDTLVIEELDKFPAEKEEE